MSKSIYDFYNGFYINQPVGNNAFSYAKRKKKQIYVPPLIQGNLSDLTPGDKIVFSEIEDDIEHNKFGLKNFIHRIINDKNIFIFDNHNHAFFFWLWGWMEKKVETDSILVHVDQHTDMRNPSKPFRGKLKENLTLDMIFQYTNYVLNVGNFIQPALDTGLISSVEMINSITAFDNPIPEKFILDIDMDIFAPELDFMDNSIKLMKLQSYIKIASFITIATSPFFIDQSLAINYINQLFE
ncbi:MAG: UPF0489 family protein [Calditrichaceae bacterium]|nr:UPF0489 family protein [Calditrichaceae bacterium]